MALTPQQQLLSDTAQQGIPSNCCLALGGYMEADDENNEVCFLDSSPAGIPSQFYLNESCGYVQSLVPNLDSPGQESGGGIFGWIGDNFQELVSGATDIIGAVGGGSTPSGGTTPQPVEPVQTQPTQGDNTIYYVLGGVLLLLVIFVLIRKFK